MKQWVSLLTAAVLCLCLLCGCGSSVEPNKVFSQADLEGKTIGVQLGTVADSIATDVKDAKVERYNKFTDAVQALKQGKIDCVIMDSQPAQTFVEKYSDLKILDDKYDDENYAICLKKGNTELKDKVNAALKTLKENGTLQQIIDNYIGDKKGTCPYTTPAGTTYPNGKLTVATNAEFEPYEFRDGDKLVGIDIEMAQALADVLGMELTINNIEFDAILSEVASGAADLGIAGMTVDEERLKNADFSDPYTTSKQVILVRAK